jgi:hypothetical protein
MRLFLLPADMTLVAAAYTLHPSRELMEPRLMPKTIEHVHWPNLIVVGRKKQEIAKAS